MARESKIAWTDATFNPWLGCQEVSPGCDHCYARTLVTGRMGKQVWGKDAPRLRTSATYWKQPLTWNRNADSSMRVFCGSLCDVMEDRADLNSHREDLYDLIRKTPNLDWLLLSKRPQNFRRFLPCGWLENPMPNVWGMTTCEGPEQQWRIDAMANTPFAVRGVSIEPLIAPLPDLNLDGIDWVIVGAESGGNARPMDKDWVRSIRDQCLASGVAFFYKQDAVNGRKIETPELDGRTWMEFPKGRL